jgi:outer membrane protein assembly factor BamB
MSDYTQREYSSYRTPRSPVSLRAPAALQWSLDRGAAAVGMPVVKGEYIVAFQGDRQTPVCLNPAGKVRWRLTRTGATRCAIVDDAALLYIERKRSTGVLLVDLASARLLLEGPVEQGFVAVLPSGQRFVERCFPNTAAVRVRAIRGGFPIVWTQDFGGKQSDTRAVVDLDVACDESQCILAVMRPRDATVTSVALENGHELWSAPIRQVGDPAREGHWKPGISHDLVVINTDKGTAAFRANDGHLAWYTPIRGARCLYGDRVFIRRASSNSPGQPSEIVVLDVRDGRVLWRRDYPEVLGKARDNRLTGYLAVTETHIFAGDDNGTVWAFDVRHGEPVWHHHPKGSEAFPPWALPVIAGGRLYITSAGDHPYLFCYEQAERADAEAETDSSAEADTRVAFTLEGVHTRQKLTRSTPYFAGGGGWTVLECGLGTQGRFFLAFSGTAPSGDGYVWVSRAADGEALLKLMRKTFSVRGFGRVPPASRVRPPRRLDVTVLGTGLEEAGSGRGSWTASKWMGEDGVPEFYVNWSVAEKRGWIAEKDDAYRNSLLTLFASLVARS